MTANTRLELRPLICPRPNCGRPMQVLMNGSTVMLRCSADAPQCGILIPVESAIAWTNERRMEAEKIDNQAGRDAHPQGSPDSQPSGRPA